MRSFVILFAALAAVTVLTPRAAEAQGFQVVAHASVPGTEISKSELSRVFQKRSNRIQGTAVVPVDLGRDSAVRESFSQAVHGRSASAIESFWQQQVFSGREVPPDQKANDAAVLSFVASTPGGIGYVSSGASVSGGVKVLRITDG